MNPDSTRNYLTGYPSQPSNSPITVTDAVGDTYYVDKDPQNNTYVTYNDQNGRYYLNVNGNKTYLRNSNTPTLRTNPKDTPVWDLVRELQAVLKSCSAK